VNGRNKIAILTRCHKTIVKILITQKLECPPRQRLNKHKAEGAKSSGKNQAGIWINRMQRKCNRERQKDGKVEFYAPLREVLNDVTSDKKLVLCRHPNCRGC